LCHPDINATNPKKSSFLSSVLEAVIKLMLIFLVLFERYEIRLTGVFDIFAGKSYL
jgi:hypothetical protein